MGWMGFSPSAEVGREELTRQGRASLSLAIPKRDGVEGIGERRQVPKVHRLRYGGRNLIFGGWTSRWATLSAH